MVVGAILIYKNRDSIKGMFTTKRTITPVKNYEQVASQVIPSTIPNDILDNLTGNKLTPTKLGYKALCSAQEINKRAVSAGLQTKLPCGEYALTEAGKLVGEYTIKTTGAGHTFQNIEWDEKTIEILFTPQELQTINEKIKLIEKVFSKK